MALTDLLQYASENIKSREGTVQRNGLRATRVYDATRALGAPRDLNTLNAPIDLEAIAIQGPQFGEVHPNFPDLLVKDVRILPIDDEGCRVVVSWEPINVDPRENEAREIWRWNLESAQRHISNVDEESKATHYPSSADTGTVIGLDGDQVHGADVYRPRQVIEVRKRYTGALTTNFRRQLKDAQNSINSNGWFEFAAREVLFIGSRIEPLGGNEWAVTFLFNVGSLQDIEVDLANGTTQNISDVSPWDHVWYSYVDEADANGTKSRRIEAVHVMEVYDSISFSLLGLSGP